MNNSFFVDKHNQFWQPFEQSRSIMHSKKLIYEGSIRYYDFKSEITLNHFQLFQDHLIRYSDVGLFQSNPEKAKKHAQVIPISLAQVNLYELDQQKQTQLKYSLLINYFKVKTVKLAFFHSGRPGREPNANLVREPKKRGHPAVLRSELQSVQIAGQRGFRHRVQMHQTGRQQRVCGESVRQISHQQEFQKPSIQGNFKTMNFNLNPILMIESHCQGNPDHETGQCSVARSTPRSL